MGTGRGRNNFMLTGPVAAAQSHPSPLKVQQSRGRHEQRRAGRARSATLLRPPGIPACSASPRAASVSGTRRAHCTLPRPPGIPACSASPRAASVSATRRAHCTLPRPPGIPACSASPRAASVSATLRAHCTLPRPPGIPACSASPRAASGVRHPPCTASKTEPPLSRCQRTSIV